MFNEAGALVWSKLLTINLTIKDNIISIFKGFQVRQVSWCVTVVVVSDDLAFLAAFAQWSLKGRLLVSSTRLLVLTDVSLLNHPTLSGIYSKMNAMLLLVKDSKKDHECSMYIQQPYSPQGAQALKVASWTPHRGLTLTSSLPLFPDKFSKYLFTS
nr:uncharacterized protein LOC123762005 [Procambarus clarkii]